MGWDWKRVRHSESRSHGQSAHDKNTHHIDEYLKQELLVELDEFQGAPGRTYVDDQGYPYRPQERVNPRAHRREKFQEDMRPRREGALDHETEFGSPKKDAQQSWKKLRTARMVGFQDDATKKRLGPAAWEYADVLPSMGGMLVSRQSVDEILWHEEQKRIAAGEIDPITKELIDVSTTSSREGALVQTGSPFAEQRARALQQKPVGADNRDPLLAAYGIIDPDKRKAEDQRSWNDMRKLREGSRLRREESLSPADDLGGEQPPGGATSPGEGSRYYEGGHYEQANEEDDLLTRTASSGDEGPSSPEDAVRGASSTTRTAQHARSNFDAAKAAAPATRRRSQLLGDREEESSSPPGKRIFFEGVHQMEDGWYEQYGGEYEEGVHWMEEAWEEEGVANPPKKAAGKKAVGGKPGSAKKASTKKAPAAAKKQVPKGKSPAKAAKATESINPAAEVDSPAEDLAPYNVEAADADGEESPTGGVREGEEESPSREEESPFRRGDGGQGFDTEESPSQFDTEAFSEGGHMSDKHQSKNVPKAAPVPGADQQQTPIRSRMNASEWQDTPSEKDTSAAQFINRVVKRRMTVDGSSPPRSKETTQKLLPDPNQPPVTSDQYVGFPAQYSRQDVEQWLKTNVPGPDIRHPKNPPAPPPPVVTMEEVEAKLRKDFNDKLLAEVKRASEAARMEEAKRWAQRLKNRDMRTNEELDWEDKLERSKIEAARKATREAMEKTFEKRLRQNETEIKERERMMWETKVSIRFSSLYTRAAGIALHRIADVFTPRGHFGRVR